MQLSLVGLKTLLFLLTNKSRWQSGTDISRATLVASGTIYPLLARLEREGWVKSKWEKIDPVKEGRPRRHLYKITQKGITYTQSTLKELQIVMHPAEP